MQKSIEFKFDNIQTAFYRPYLVKNIYFDKDLIDRPGDMINYIGIESKILSISGPSSNKGFSALGVKYLSSLDLLEKTQFLPLYRYTKSGERIDNITDWALAEFQKTYTLPSPHSPSIDARPSPLAGEGGPQSGSGEGLQPPSPPHPVASGDHLLPRGEKVHNVITKRDIFHYVYAVLHDPLYREKYALNLKREFPRIPFYSDFFQWAAWGERLMALHTGFETVEPWPLERIDTEDAKAKAAGLSPKPVLKSNHETGNIVLDSETQLRGLPPDVWRYKLGNRTALDWILDQYKEKKPNDPTIREKFNTYRFANYKERVIDLLMRVTRVSVETIAITDAMIEQKR